MIELSNTLDQVIQPGQAITFNIVVLHTGNGECHRPGTSSVKMKANGIYVASFSANIGVSGAAGRAQIAMAVGNEVLPESTMISETAADGNLNNVAKEIPIKNCCCDYDRLTIINTGTTPVLVSALGLSLFVRRAS